MSDRDHGHALVLAGRRRRRTRASGWAVLIGPLLLWPLAAATAAPGSPDAGKAIALRGTPRGVAACSACHGASGGGQAEIGAPRLAALNATYLAHQLSAFGDGTRDNAIMTPIATMLDAQARADLSAYYATLPAPPGPPSSASPAVVEAGQALALRGDWPATIPPCASCHGTDGLGVGTAFPTLAGQSDAYIAAQLAAWRAGTRKGDSLGMMTAISARLDAREITAVAAYYGSLPSAYAPEGKIPSGSPPSGSSP